MTASSSPGRTWRRLSGQCRMPVLARRAPACVRIVGRRCAGLSGMAGGAPAVGTTYADDVVDSRRQCRRQRHCGGHVGGVVAALPVTLSGPVHEYGPHRGRRGARPARREEGEYRAYLTDEQRRRPGCIGGRMRRYLCIGPLSLFALLLAGCAPAPSASERAEGVRVVRAQVRGIT